MNEAVHQIIAGNIRSLRQSRGWSVRQLAEECAKRGAPNLTHPSITNLERGPDSKSPRGPRAITVEELVFLADLFGVTPNDLFTAPVMVTCDRCGGTGTVRAGKDGAQ